MPIGLKEMGRFAKEAALANDGSGMTCAIRGPWRKGPL
jgi:hypothetical protein